jgi:hypothetical protein
VSEGEKTNARNPLINRDDAFAARDHFLRTARRTAEQRQQGRAIGYPDGAGANGFTNGCTTCHTADSGYRICQRI